MALSVELRTYSLKSVATWSLRERAVCSFLPLSPILATSSFSTKECMSSASFISMAPASMSAYMASSPPHISSHSASDIMPHLPSILACATEAVMSSLHNFLSKGSESLKSSASFAVGASNLPCHSFITNHPLIKLTYLPF